MLKRGDKVVMHTCIEAGQHEGKIWTCETDEFKMCDHKAVRLEGYSSSFSVEFLAKVNIGDD